MYPTLVRSLLLPISERALGLPIISNLKQLMESQWWPSDRLRGLQLNKLRRLLLHAKHTIPHFRDLMSGVTEARIETEPLAVYAGLPYLLKERIREEFPVRIVSESFTERDYKKTATAGSTGRPFKYVVSKSGYAAWWAHHLRAFEAAGYRLGDKTVYLGGVRKMTSVRRVRDLLIRQIQPVDAYKSSERLFDEYVARIARYRPRILRGFPEMLFLLAEAAERKGVRDIRPVSVISNSDKVHGFQRKYIEQVFQAPVFDYYSCPESGAFAFQCEKRDGYHLALEHGFVEFADESWNPIDFTAGTSPVTGAIVSTNLDNMAMGFIRYVTGDFASVRGTAGPSVSNAGGAGALADLPGRACNCGRGLPVIESVEGRAHSLIITRDGRYLHGVLFELLFLHTETLRDLGQWVDRIQFVQETADLVVVNVLRQREGTGAAVQEETLSQAVAEVKQLLGPGMSVEVRFVDHIQQPPSGKRQLVVSKVLPERMRPRNEIHWA